MTSAIILTSNSMRHKYFASAMASEFDIKGIISEPKNDYFEKQLSESDIVKEHFANLLKYEKKYLNGDAKFPSAPILEIDKKLINDLAVIEWTKKKTPDAILLFGTGILSDEWLDKFESRIINLHLGHSPRYRGSATLFWPFFNEEIDFVGATIHLANKKIDAGNILKIVKPKIEPTDNYYDINFKTIKKSIDEFGPITLDFLSGKINAIPQNEKEQLYLYKKSDFSEDCLIKVLKKYGIQSSHN